MRIPIDSKPCPKLQIQHTIILWLELTRTSLFLTNTISYMPSDACLRNCGATDFDASERHAQHPDEPFWVLPLPKAYKVGKFFILYYCVFLHGVLRPLMKNPASTLGLIVHRLYHLPVYAIIF